MIKFLKNCWGVWQTIVNWFHREVQESANNIMRDFRSLRALWNWIYLALYVFLCIWAAVFYPKIALVTAIITTGTIVSVIFTVYVLSTHKEKMNGKRKKPEVTDDVNGSA